MSKKGLITAEMFHLLMMKKQVSPDGIKAMIKAVQLSKELYSKLIGIFPRPEGFNGKNKNNNILFLRITSPRWKITK